MSRTLDVRIGFRLPIVIAGMLLATGRRTAASWFRAAGVNADWDCFYNLLASVGRSSASLMPAVARVVLKRFDPGPDGYWTLAVDDSPTKRYGRHVEAANIHHNPTAGPGDGEWLYGHNWVCLAVVLSHPLFGVIALALLSMLYVRKDDIASLKSRYDWKFQTKHELALQLCLRAIGTFRALGSTAKVLVTFDGAYAAKPLVRPLLAAGVAIVTRLRCDAKLFDVPKARVGQRGRPRKYGPNRLSLKKRAGQRSGWETICYACRGIMVERKCKSFVATSEVFGGSIRVVIVQYSRGNWAAYASSDISMSIEMILTTVANRWSIEEHFHDVKEIWGAGQQQVRNLYSNIGCWNLCGWLHALVELECWDKPREQLVDRSDRPWDNPDRRPSHADRRRQIAREMLRQTFSHDLQNEPDHDKIKERFEQLIALAA